MRAQPRFTPAPRTMHEKTKYCLINHSSHDLRPRRVQCTRLFLSRLALCASFIHAFCVPDSRRTSDFSRSRFARISPVRPHGFILAAGKIYLCLYRHGTFHTRRVQCTRLFLSRLALCVSFIHAFCVPDSRRTSDFSRSRFARISPVRPHGFILATGKIYLCLYRHGTFRLRLQRQKS